MEEALARNRVLRVGLLLAILALGSYARLVSLDDISLRGDSLHFWTICRAPDLTAWDTVTQWEQMGVGQPPLPLTVTRWYIDAFNLPVTFFTIRLPSAIFGILAIPVMYAIGVGMAGLCGGLLLALLVALSPFHIQMSCESYFYASLILGSMMLFRAFLDVLQTVENPRRLPASWHASVFVGFLLVIHSQFTGWSAAYLYAACMLGLLLWRWKKRADLAARHDFILALVLFGIQTVVLVLAPWGPGHVLAKIWSPLKSMYAAVADRSGETAFSMTWKTFAMFGWGMTPGRLLFTLAVTANGIWSLARDPARRLRHAMMGGVLVLNFIIFFVSREATASVYESRYVAGLLPIYLYLFGRGLLDWRWLAPRLRAASATAAVAAAAGLLVYPAYLCTRLTGQPAPYLDIVRWADAHLPKGTPLLFDRWYEPWNEMTAHPSTNVVFTFTVPNEPVETYLRNQWRQSAQQFFARHPDAAFVEMARTYYDVPGVGPWDWPRRHFAHEVSIRNEAGVRLRELGLAGRGEYYTVTTNRLIVDIFYNTREDQMRRAQAAGVRVFSWYGKGWWFEKSGPMGMFRLQTPDFRDWRVLNDTAELELINVTTSPIVVHVRLRAVAAGGSKTVRVTPTMTKDFPAGQVSEWRFGPLALQPGINILTLHDPLWSLGKSLLLVEGIAVEEAPPGTELSEAATPIPAARP